MPGPAIIRTRTLLGGALFLALVAVVLWLYDPGRIRRLAGPLAGSWTRPSAPAAAPPASGADDDVPARALFAVASTDTAFTALKGGVLELPSGIGRLEVPAGALDRDTTIVASEVRAEDSGALAVDLQPDGLTFAAPARLELAAPEGLSAAEVEIVVYEPGRTAWTPEPDQAPGTDPDHVVARITHLSLRRVRIRPGMNFPFDPRRARGTFFLESDPGNTYEKLIDGHWQLVGRRTPAFRELVKMGRLGRSDLIASGRLRAVAATVGAAEQLNDALREVILPRGAPPARTGWVNVIRLDAAGTKTGVATVARVIPAGDESSQRTAPTIRMSRAVMEALGLTWGVDFGVSDQDRERTIIRVAARAGDSPERFVSVMVEPWAPAAASAR